MRSHEVDYQIFGDDMQFVEIELDPGETVNLRGILRAAISNAKAGMPC